MSRSHWITCSLAIVIIAFAGGPVQADDSENLVRFGVGWYATVGDADDVSDNGLAAWGSYERRFAQKLGAEFMIAYVDYDSILDLLGGISLTSVTAALNYHVDAGEKVDVFMGPILGVAELEVDGGGLFGLADASSETEFAWGAAVGVDTPSGDARWGFSGSLRFLTAEFDGGDFDNVVFHAGAVRRF